jgi:AGZA family xanthine/uracil permease-like MFS transporter
MENAKADEYFGYTEKGGTFDGEIRAGFTTFLTMAYILLVNPAMLTVAIGDGTTAGNEQAFADILFATAVAAFVGCTVMGLWANLPFALAPGMGLNAYFTFGVVLGMGIAWEVALFAVFVEGLIFMVMSLPQVGWRTQMINSIPTDLKIATGAGIGMFLSIIGFREMGWIRDDGATLVNIADTEKWGATSYGIPDGWCHAMDYATMTCTEVQDGYFELGNYGLHQEGAIIGMIALLAIAVLMARGIKGAMIYGIIVASIYGWAVGASDPYNFYFDGAPGWGASTAAAPELGSILSMPSMPEETLFAAFGDAGMGALEKSNMGDFLLVMIAFLFVDIFDTSGTLYSVGRQAGYVDENDELMNSDEAFMSDAAATIVGAVLGTSTTTTYIESAAGVEDGGKTGLVAVTVGVLMLSGLFFTNLFAAIPQYAMASALVIVGAMMMRQAADIDWNNAEMALPAFITMVMMPFTYSIADGIAWGIIAWVVIKVGMGKFDEINKVMGILAVLMIMFYIGPGDESTFGWLLSTLGF